MSIPKLVPMDYSVIPMDIDNLQVSTEVFVRTSKVPKRPKSFPDFRVNAVMFVAWGKTGMQLLYNVKKYQHTFFKFKGFKYFIGQGEYDEKGQIHAQCLLQMQRGFQIRASALWKLCQPHCPEALQVVKSVSPILAMHYCSKPHCGCDCEQCQKERSHKLKWCQPISVGDPPTGQGKKFGAMEKSIKAGANLGDVIEDYGALYMRYHGGIEKIIKHYKFKAKVANTPNPMREFDPKHWMIIEAARSFLPKPKREIVWVWSYKLNTCKSSFMEWLIYIHNYQVICDMASFKDICMVYDEETFFYMNFARFTDWSDAETGRKLKLLERLDDGGFSRSGKYGGSKNIMNMKIYVTANRPPPECWMPQDPDTRCRCICLDPPKKRRNPFLNTLIGTYREFPANHLPPYAVGKPYSNRALGPFSKRRKL